MTSTDYLIQLIRDLKDIPILCVGDLMLDRFVYGDVSRISPEAPIPILHVKKQFHTLGGAGNVVNNILSLGGIPYVISVVGEDRYGDELRRMLIDKQVNSTGVVAIPQVHTTVKHRYCGREQQLLRVDYETITDFPDEIYQTLVEHAKKYLPQVNALVLSDYGKGTLHPHKVIRPLIEMAQAQGVPVIADPKGFDYGIYRGVTVITPNRKELHEATNMPTFTDEEVIAASQSLLDKTGVNNVLATRSEQGMTLVPSQGLSTHIRAAAREVFDVSGAGDTVVAMMALGLGAGASLVDTARMANVAGTVVVGKVGTATASPDELIQEIQAETIDFIHKKHANRVEAIDYVHRWRRKGEKVGFTNGCFDLFHLGHLSLLRQAKNVCDRLVVGVNADASVQRLKGSNRPIQSEETRATILSALAIVDLVVVFGEDTPYELIKALQPDVLVKGSDYTADRVVGADIVLKAGGSVVLADLEPGMSTTSTVARIHTLSPSEG